MSETVCDDHQDARHAAQASAARFAPLLEQEIDRYQRAARRKMPAAVPWFPEVLERKFEDDTCEARVRDLRFAMMLGAVFYFATVLMDPVFVPDLGWEAFGLRMLAVPFIIFDLSVGTSLRGPTREWLLTITACVVVAALAVIPAISTAPFAPYAFATAILAAVYANTTVVLRFDKACWFTGYCVLLIGGLAVWSEGLGHALGWAIALQVVLAALFSLVANHHIEWSVRLSYLLGSREAARLQAMAADRETFRTLSCIDELTQLANRGAFNRRCAAEFSDPANRGLPAALLMIDVDQFKRYNDHYGHIAGDVCLRTVAQRISETVRSANDAVARYGGEEFVILLCGVGSARATRLAERICESVRDLGLDHENRDDGVPHVTISVGVATTQMDPASSVEELIEAADRGLYAAKRAGRNRVEPAPLVSAA